MSNRSFDKYKRKILDRMVGPHLSRKRGQAILKRDELELKRAWKHGQQSIPTNEVAGFLKRLEFSK
jgi:hypothetical protein